MKENIQDFNKYEIVYTNYIEIYNEYSIKCMRKLNGLMTQDTVKINVNDFGEIVSFAAFHQGEFEQYSDVNIDLEVINTTLLETVKNKYANEIEETKIESQLLRIFENKLVLQTEMEIILKNNESKFEVIIYEIN